ncbi:right-handed parallel beta-helix repeat-containing protein [Chloroherpeton thalassium]|nr:right-handed parallel beta-helix repeat-containing protein [Chloroherpeton thalassium]
MCKYSIGLKYLMLVFISISFFGCGDNDEEKKKITGKVLIEDDESGATSVPEETVLIQVYSVSNNQSIQKIRNEAPGTGFENSWRHLFSHHDSNIGSAQTNSNGEFSIEFSSDNELFNLALSSDKYGLKYVYGVKAEDIGEIEMYEEEVFKTRATISTFKTGHSYRFTGSNTSLLSQDGSVSFEAGTIIRLDEDAKLDIYATGNTISFNGLDDNPVVVTSENSNDTWGQVTLYADAVNMTNTKIELCGLSVGNCEKIDINKAVFLNNKYAFTYTNTDSCYVTNCLFVGNMQGALLRRGGELKNCIFSETDENAVVVEGTGYESSWTGPIVVKNNYINQTGENAIDVSQANINIYNNTVNGAAVGVFCTYESWGNISYNTIKSIENYSIWIKAGEVQDGSPSGACKFLGSYGSISYNNIKPPDTDGLYAFYHADGGNVNAINNYWYDTDSTIINDELLKYNVRIAASYNSGNIVFVPYQISEIDSAGAE